jgi:flagellar biosynthesis/type III secretory pathway chaperone
MKYTKEAEQQLVLDYQSGVPLEEIAKALLVPKKSVIAKLSSLGVYRRKTYLTKRGETPRSKAEVVDSISELLDRDPQLLESLEKANKSVLLLLETALLPK